MIYIDESGSITTSKDKKKRYFVISVVETEDPKKVSRVFRRAKKTYIKNHPSLSGLDYRYEIKGSEMPLKMKSFIYKELINKTDLKLHYVVIDNWHLKKQLHDDVEICFNFVLCNYFEQLCKKDRHNILDIRLDERNCAVGSTNTLGSYLKTELYVKKELVEKFKECDYLVSENEDLIQIADLLANTVYRACKSYSKNPLDNNGNQQLLRNIETENNMYFPYKHNELSFFTNDIF